MTLEMFIERFGAIAGLAVFIIFDKVVPFLMNKYFPERIKAAADKRTAEIRAADEERLARLSELADERKWHREVEAERLAEMKQIREAVQAIKLSLVQNASDNLAIRTAAEEMTKRQYLIINKLDIHHDATMDAVADMREAVARRDGVEKGKKLPKTGPFKEEDKP